MIKNTLNLFKHRYIKYLHFKNQQGQQKTYLKAKVFTAILFISVGFIYLTKPTAEAQINPLVNKNDLFFLDFPIKKASSSQKLASFIKLLKITEGKDYSFYKDNIGIAIGYGWNPTRNSYEFNKKMIESIYLPLDIKNNILLISNTRSISEIPNELKKFSLSESQLITLTANMMTIYENEFLKALQHHTQKEDLTALYYKLPVQQQSVLTHMAYKVGLSNLLKYDNFFNNLSVYLKEPTDSNLFNLLSELEYFYKNKNGELIADKTTKELHSLFFSDCFSNNNNKICNHLFENIKTKI